MQGDDGVDPRLRGSGKRRNKLEKNKRIGKEAVSVITPSAFAFDVATIIFPPPVWM